jgi:hypothetical protein
MKNKVLCAVYSIIFVFMLVMPMAFVNLYGGVVSAKENRTLATRPPISYMFKHPRDFIRMFDDWFSDNVGFREGFIDYYKKFMNLESNIQYTDGQYLMLIGEQGHHYFAHTKGWMISKFQGQPFVSEEQLQGLADGLNKAKQYLDEKGIPLIVMFCADKEEIYPEYYPKSILRGPEPTQLDRITEYTRSHAGVDLFNIKECLLLAKQNYPVFDKVGDAAGILSHYNEIGAFFAYQELMKHIKVYISEMDAFTLNDVDITYTERGIYPNIPDVHLKRELTYTRLESDFFDNVPISHPSHGVAFENNNSTLPTILLMRDSYAGNANYLSRYIPEHFAKTILIHWANIANLKSYVEYFKPDIVVFESAERELGGFSNSVSNITLVQNKK